MRSISRIVGDGVNCLLERLGTVETEIFISYFIHERSDYTKWRRNNLYADVSLHELNQRAAKYAKDHPFHQDLS